MIHQANTPYTCTSDYGCVVTGVDGATWTLSVAPSVQGGARVLGPGSTPATWETYDGNPLNDVVDAVAGYLNAQFNSDFDRTTSTPPLGVVGDTGITAANTATGRALYGSTDGGATLAFGGFVRSTTNDNGNPARIRVELVMNADQTDADEALVNGRIDPGAELWIGDVGDDGTSTTFLVAGGSSTTATSFSLHGANQAYVQKGDTINCVASPYSTSTKVL